MRNIRSQREKDRGREGAGEWEGERRERKRDRERDPSIVPTFRAEVSLAVSIGYTDPHCSSARCFAYGCRYAQIDIHVPFYDYFKPFLFLTHEAGTHSRLAERAGTLSVSGCKNESVVLHLRVFDLFTLKQMSFFFCVFNVVDGTSRLMLRGGV